MSESARRYCDWKAPAEDGGVLIWPQPDEVLRDTLDNQRRLRGEATAVQNVPMAQVRRRMREFIGHTNDERPLLASGHQTELYHVGVWAKDAFLHAAASRLGGQAYHIAVDTDAPKHLILRWPGSDAAPMTDDHRLTSAAWCGVLALPTPLHVQALLAQFHESAHAWDFEPLLPNVLASLRRSALESHNLSGALTNAQHELDWELGLRHHALLASPIWLAEPFLAFAHHAIARAGKFASDYNAALADYRAHRGMRTNVRPMTDLFVSGSSVETPFWLDDLASGRRSRPSVFLTDRGWVLQLLTGEEFVFDENVDGWDAAANLARWLTAAAHRLAPRALTLTMFVRLMLADQFVHGIGGGRYDQVTDRLIARHFGIEPPKFSVTTATLYFPSAVARQRACVPCVLHEGHRLHHAALGARKHELVEAIGALPRRSPQREALFQQMRGELESASAVSAALARWRRTLEQTRRLEREEQHYFDRELFYAIQPRERLHELIRGYNKAFGTNGAGT